MSHVYISKGLRKDIPSDAILLQRSEVLEMHWKTIREWKPRSQIWPFTYGIGILTATTASTAMHFVQRYRTKLKLGNYGRVTMVLPTIVLPTLGAVCSHMFTVTNPILLGVECPLCIQTRAAFVQVLCGVIGPVIVTPILGFYFATSFGTYDVPPVRKEYLKEVGQLWLKLIRGLKHRVPIAIGINAVLASSLAYFEAKSFYRCQQTIYEREEEFRKLVESKQEVF